jgi:quinohemoprotein ethanol dehydrogenase
MTRLPRNASACLSLGAVGALLLGLAISPHRALAEDLTPARIKAATSAVDSAMIKANTATSKDWPTIGLD